MEQFKHIKGGEELQKFLDELPVKIERNIMRGALRQGGNVYKTEMKLNLASNNSVKTAELQNGIKVSTRAKRGTVTASVKVKGKHAHVAYWIEFTGASPHKIKGKYGLALAFAGGVYKEIEHPGFKAKPFARPAFDAKSGEATVAVGNAVKARLTKEGLDTSNVEVDEA